MRARVWIGDVVRALAVAQNEEQETKILRLLGYEATSTAPAEEPRPARTWPSVPGSHPTAHHTEDDCVDEPPSPAEDDTAPEPPADEAHHPEPTAATAGLPLLDPVRTDPPVAPPAPDEPLAEPVARRRATLPHLPLLTPRWTSAILRTTLSRQVDEGPVDIPALLDTLAHGRPVTRLPRRPVPTLRHGAQVLVDRSIGMQPFRRDQDDLVTRIREVVGADLVDVVHFSGVPHHGTGPGRRRRPARYEPPARGTPVLLLSDLGVGGRSHDSGPDPEDWEEFVGLVTRAGCPVVALTPYPPNRRLDRTAQLLPQLTWDRSTTTGRARAVVRARTR
ncbi:hypothetical protein [Streptomyces sp. NPDC101166]|uniref:hypothetical protein n=1 Tax=Streptomyces sp. NPDC101166 TaxID=3366120 RepID=UPI003823E06B